MEGRGEGRGGQSKLRKMNVLILQPNILGTIMSSCACCASEEYDNASMLRGVQVPLAREK